MSLTSLKGSDSNKIDQLKEIVSNNNNIDVYAVVCKISADSYKITALEIMKNCHMKVNDIRPIVQSISSDSYKVNALKILRFMTNEKITASISGCIINNISSDSYKVKALEELWRFELLSPFNFDEIAIEIIEGVSSDSHKIAALNPLMSCTISPETLKQVVDGISSDTYKVEALKIFKNSYEFLTESDKKEIVNYISSTSYQSTARKILGLKEEDNASNNNFNKSNIKSYHYGTTTIGIGGKMLINGNATIGVNPYSKYFFTVNQNGSIKSVDGIFDGTVQLGYITIDPPQNGNRTFKNESGGIGKLEPGEYCVYSGIVYNKTSGEEVACVSLDDIFKKHVQKPVVNIPKPAVDQKELEEENQKYSKVENDGKQELKNACEICYERVFAPYIKNCKHGNLCLRCLDLELKKENPTCCSCRSPVTSIEKIFVHYN